MEDAAISLRLAEGRALQVVKSKSKDSRPALRPLTGLVGKRSLQVLSQGRQMDAQAVEKEANRQRELIQKRHAAEHLQAERLAVKRTMDNPDVKHSPLARMAAAGNRCMLCLTPLRVPGICAACMAGGRDEE